MNKTIYVIALVLSLYLAVVLGLQYAIEQGWTNAESGIINARTSNSLEYENIAYLNTGETKIIHDYIISNLLVGEDLLAAREYIKQGEATTSWFPSHLTSHEGFSFVLSGIDKRKDFVSSVEKHSAELGIDPDLVMACVLGEQIRIARGGLRGQLKGIILSTTPTLFRSYDTSFGIGGIKLSTAYQIKKDAISYGYGTGIRYDTIIDKALQSNDAFNAKYATYLVKNIIHRRAAAGHDISNKPGVVCTLYNMGNDKDKEPHANPSIGGAIITLNGHEYVYGGLSRGVYYYLKIYK